MKKSIFLLTFIFVACISFAQKGKVTSAETLKETGKLGEALKTIELTIDPNNAKAESTIPWPKTWEVRGSIFQAIFQSKDTNLKKLEADPLTKAFDSYKKAMQLDADGKFTKSLVVRFTFLQPDLYKQGAEAFNKEDYKLALQSFEQYLEINKIPIMKVDNKDVIDTVILFNAAIAAFDAKEYEKAIKYYMEVAKCGYNEGRTYQQIATTYELMGDTVKSLTTLQEGFKKYPTDSQILVKLINIYLVTNKTDDAMKYLDLAIKQDPGNATFYFAQGALFDQLNRREDAIKSYETAIEKNPDLFNANYNLGALYYNEGVKQWDVARAVPANENAKYLAEMAKCDVWWNKALPYMEKCHKLNDKDVSTIESLKNLYYRMMAKDRTAWEPKYKEMDTLLKNFKK